VLLCGLLWVVGSPTVTALFGSPAGELLARLGTGQRFESILRGVLDLRDLAYFASLVGVFLALNHHQLLRLRWAGNPTRPAHRRATALAALVAANFAAANLWLAQIPWARLDLTRGGQYSLSAATRDELARLREPLLIRGYFSARTHPLLAPLVPRLQDVLLEYGVAAGDRARVELIDPQRSRAAESEAAERFGVRPVPFQTADRYQSAVVSSYFDVVVAYGDQSVKLGLQELVEVKASGTNAIEVALRDPEYAVTSAIRKVVSGYRGGGSPFDALDAPVTVRALLSAPDLLPEPFRPARAALEAALAELGKQGGDKLRVSFEDPGADGGKLGQELGQRYGLVPRVVSLADPRPFWFTLLLEGNHQTLEVPIPEKLDRDAFRAVIEKTVRRLAPGVLRTVGLVTPPAEPPQEGDYTVLQQTLAQSARVQPTALDGGRVPEEVDLLLVLAPRALSEVQRFAIDQFLMRGGSVVVATSPFEVRMGGGLNVSRSSSGLEEWLAGQGIRIGESMVLDPRSAALPIPVQRLVGGISVQEIQLVPYPLFVDLREEGLDRRHPVTAALGQLTVPWASPIELVPERTQGRAVTRLLTSSAGSWLSSGPVVVPDWSADPDTGFAPSGERGPRTLAVAMEGPFESGFKGKPAPGEAGAASPPPAVVERSPASARLVVVASNAFASNTSVNLASEGMRTLYLKPVELLMNAVDWSLEDPALLALRGRSRYAATLLPLSEGARRGWEYATYALVLGALGLVLAWRLAVARADRRRHALVLQEVKP